jgi:hypothetical protein
LKQIAIVLDERRQFFKLSLNRPSVRGADVRYNGVKAINLVDPALPEGFHGGGDGEIGTAALTLQDDLADAELGFVRGDMLHRRSAVVESRWERIVLGCRVGIAEVDENRDNAFCGEGVGPASVDFAGCWERNLLDRLESLASTMSKNEWDGTHHAATVEVDHRRQRSLDSRRLVNVQLDIVIVDAFDRLLGYLDGRFVCISRQLVW